MTCNIQSRSQRASDASGAVPGISTLPATIRTRPRCCLSPTSRWSARCRHRPPHLRGASFGLRQSLDTIDALLGPLIAIGLMWLTADPFQVVCSGLPSIPAFLSVGLILVAVKEPDRPKEQRRVRMPLHRDELRRLTAYVGG